MQMSNAEICASFKQAKNQNDQISILAELNACGTAEILEILQAGGCISGLPKVKREVDVGKRDKVVWTAELDKELIAYCEAGKGPSEIAELMGLQVEQVSNRKARLKAKGYIFGTGQTETTETDVLALKPLTMLLNNLPDGLEQVSAAVRLVDEAGNVWKMELSREY